MRFCFQLALGAGLALTASAASLPESRTVKTVVRADANGRLVRSTVVTPRVVHENVIAPVTAGQEPPAAAAEPQPPKAPPSTFREAVDRIAERNNLSPQLVHSVIKVESNYNPNAISPKGALGLMQLIPSTARRFGVSNAFNPVENVEGGARYLRYLLDLYKGDYRLALAAYNAGEGAVARHGGVPPYAETVNYLQQVRNRLAEAQQEKKKVEPKPEPPKAPAPGRVKIVEIVESDGKVRYVSK
jgi:soluble lytic murein transglycosylase-like protein